MSFQNWVGLLVERTLISLLRGPRIRTNETIDLVALEEISPLDPLPRLESRSELSELCLRARASLSPRALAMFESLCVSQEDIGATAISKGMKEQALYAMRARLQRWARKMTYGEP